MSKQLHKNFTNDQVKSLLKSYLDKEIKIDYILQIGAEKARAIAAPILDSIKNKIGLR